MSDSQDLPGLFGDPGAIEPAALDTADAATAAQLPGSVHLGTSSWSFPGWAGLVWRTADAASLTETRLARRGLTAYSSHPLLRAVGIDRSYYAPLSERECQDYAAAVPDGFRFVMKADRALVFPDIPGSAGQPLGANPRMLDAAHAERQVIGPAVAGFGEKLGVVVFQFPPLGPVWIGRNGGVGAFADRLHDFLASLPIGPEYAVEIRDHTLLTESYAAALRNAGVSHCFAVHPSMPPITAQAGVVGAAAQRLVLVRWMLNPAVGLSYRDAKARYQPFNRLVDEDQASRQQIAAVVAEAGSRPAYVIINNKAEGSAPLSVQSLAREIVAMSSSGS
jgi:uncharacterized protein YecE (DUF72 family)